MNDEKIRVEFELWAVSDAAECGMDLKFEFDPGAGWYLGSSGKHMNLAWAAWQASRESLVIELPETIGVYAHPESDREWVLDPDDVRAAIEAAGLKVKP